MAKNFVVSKKFLDDFGKSFVVSNLTYFLPKRKFFNPFFALLGIKKALLKAKSPSCGNGKIYDGKLMCTYYSDGSFGRIENNILQLEAYKEFPIISQKEAYQKLQAGEFLYYREDEEVLDIEVLAVELDYILDTKGFYQPVYQFEVIAGEYWTTIMIPAIK
jgi:hypothetical protein